MMRVGMFLATNMAVMLVLGIVMSILSRVFGINLSGGNAALLVYSAVLGFVGSLISLFMSKSSAKRSMNVQIIEDPTNETESWLVNTVSRQAEAAGIGMPEVGIFNAPESNAFATGWNKNKALVAVSTGLMSDMSQNEVEAVLAHEVSHVANGDMVTMTLIQGVMNTFVFFFASIVGRFVDQAISSRGDQRGGGRRHGFGYYITRTIAQMLFGFLANIIVMWFSRRREYRADAGGAKLAGRENMVAALERLRGSHGRAEMPSQLQAFGISSSHVKKLARTHPALEDRIAALNNQS